MKVEDIKIKSKNNYNISVSLYIPNEDLDKIVIACHGFGGDKESSAIKYLAETIYKDNIGLICSPFKAYSIVLGIYEKSNTKDLGLVIGLSCLKGTK